MAMSQCRDDPKKGEIMETKTETKTKTKPNAKPRTASAKPRTASAKPSVRVWAKALEKALAGEYGPQAARYYAAAVRNHRKDGFSRVLARPESAPDFEAWETGFIPALIAKGGQAMAGSGIGRAAFAAMIRETMEANREAKAGAAK